MALSHVKEPLLTRIARWAMSGKATKILLHPSDYAILEKSGRMSAIEERFSLPVVCLGGEEAMARFLAENKGDEEGEES